MYLLAVLDSPEVCAPIRGLIHGVVLTSTADVRPLRACKIAVNGNFMCHTECKWALQILLGPSIYVSDSGKAQAQWPQAAGSRYYCTKSSLFNNKYTENTQKNLHLHSLLLALKRKMFSLFKCKTQMRCFTVQGKMRKNFFFFDYVHQQIDWTGLEPLITHKN